MSGVAATAVVTKRLQDLLGTTAKVWNTLDTTVDPKEFKDRFTTAQKVHVYEVTREASSPREGNDSQAIARCEQVSIYGFYSYQLGVSEPVFQAEIDSITAAFDAPRLRQFTAEDGPALGVEWSSAPSVEGPKIARFGEVLVHYARITLTVDFDPIF